MNTSALPFIELAASSQAAITDTLETNLENEASAMLDGLITKLIKVGEISFTDLNGAGGGTTITTSFSAGKPVDTLFKKGFIKQLTPLVSYTGVTLDEVQSKVTAGGDTNAVQAVAAAIKFASGVGNPANWTSGKLGVYIIADAIPAVS